MTRAETVGGGLGLDPELSADCVHCGLCLETCPTFSETGDEAESPRGRILLARGLALGRWTADPDVLGPLDRCLGCRACETVCPSGVAYGHLLETTRAALRRGGARPRSRLESFLVRRVLWRGAFLARAAGPYRGLRLWRWGTRLARAPGIPADWRRRLLLLPRAESPAGKPAANGGYGPPAWVLRGCVARALFPETERATIMLLAAAGYDAGLLDRPSCCGALAAHVGEADLAGKLAHEAVVSAPTAGWIVPTAAGCGAHLKALEQGAPAADAGAASALAARVRDLSELLVDGPRPLRFVAPDPRPRVVFQDPCHLRHGQGVVEPPRQLLEQAGADLVEAEEPELCCGSAGTYNLAEASMAERLGRRKAAVLARTGAETVVTANPGCAIQLGAYLGEATPVVPLARFLAERLLPEGG